MSDWELVADTAHDGIHPQDVFRGEHDRIVGCVLAGQRDALPVVFCERVAGDLTVANAETGTIHDFRDAEIETPLPMKMSLSRYYCTGDVRQIEATLTSSAENATHAKLEVTGEPNGRLLAVEELSLTSEQTDHVVSFDIAQWEPLSPRKTRPPWGATMYVVLDLEAKAAILPG